MVNHESIFVVLQSPRRTISYAEELGYYVIKKLQLGGESGWDYQTVDSATRRLYIYRSTHVLVVDIDTEKLVGDIADTAGVHEIAIASELTRGFTSNGKANTATIFYLKTLNVLGQVKTGRIPMLSRTTLPLNKYSLSMVAARTLRCSKPLPVVLPARSPLEVTLNLQRQMVKARSM